MDLHFHGCHDGNSKRGANFRNLGKDQERTVYGVVTECRNKNSMGIRGMEFNIVGDTK